MPYTEYAMNHPCVIIATMTLLLQISVTLLLHIRPFRSMSDIFFYDWSPVYRTYSTVLSLHLKEWIINTDLLRGFYWRRPSKRYMPFTRRLIYTVFPLLVFMYALKITYSQWWIGFDAVANKTLPRLAENIFLYGTHHE